MYLLVVLSLLFWINYFLWWFSGADGVLKSQNIPLTVIDTYVDLSLVLLT